MGPAPALPPAAAAIRAGGLLARARGAEKGGTGAEGEAVVCEDECRSGKAPKSRESSCSRSSCTVAFSLREKRRAGGWGGGRGGQKKGEEEGRGRGRGGGWGGTTCCISRCSLSRFFALLTEGGAMAAEGAASLCDHCSGGRAQGHDTWAAAAGTR